MEAPAVCTLADEKINITDKFRIPQDRAIRPSQIAGETDAHSRAVLRDVEHRYCRAENMPCIVLKAKSPSV
jgi:hypothetical protein